jgi:uncharacterized iron-regulated membrane protein
MFDRLLVWIHRWVGVVLGLFFAMWFASGAIMIYVPFPSLSHDSVLARSSAVNLQQVTTPPALATLGLPADEIDRVRLIDVNGLPVYVVHPYGAAVVVVNAQDGWLHEQFDAATAKAVGERFAGHPVARVEGPIADDQWIVANGFDAYRPFYRLHVEDAAESVLYVSARTGEILQKTTARERAWNYLGAVVHWIYPTIIRRHWALWDQLVWWLSLVGITVAVIGLWLGITRLAGRQRSGVWKFSHYRRWMKWHHVLGLFAGVLALTWIFSGWLSMDHNRLFSSPDATEERVARFRGLDLQQAAARIPLTALAAAEPFAEAEIVTVGGATFVSTGSAGGPRLYALQDGTLRAMDKVPESLIDAAVHAAWPEGATKIEHPAADDAYGQLRESTLPASTVRVVIDDPAETWVHVDTASGALLGVMDRSRRVYRWLFNGLHSLDFPGLANHHPLWDGVILIALLAGFAFSVTSVVIGFKRTRAKLIDRWLPPR